MPKLTAFIQVTLDGYFAATNGDISWAHKDRDDAEWNAFVAGNAKGGSRLVFGRVTYELMANYWPTPLAVNNDPVIAEQMNNLPKVVFSRTLDNASWNNTKLVKGDIAAAIEKMKKEPGPDMAILGSGSIISQLAEQRLIDKLQIVVNPLVLGKGRKLFDRLDATLALRLLKTRVFGNGNVMLCYAPVA